MTAAFVLPDGLEASAPSPQRDAVRLMVARPGHIEHAGFAAFAGYLRPGDLVVVNTSATLAASVPATRAGRPVEIHFSTELDDGTWVLEVRSGAASTGPLTEVRPGDRLDLPAGGRAVIEEAHPAGQTRLWRARVMVETGLVSYLERHGRAIRYSYVHRDWPMAEYQTVFGREPGSAEMPSAGRPFTDRIVTDLVTGGIGVAPITLHTGVSSQEAGEPPQPERFAVSARTAELVNTARHAGGRVVAVGTTVTRALESAADPDGTVRARHGWTDLVLGGERRARVVDGLVTGWHAPGASHLKLLEAVAGKELVDAAYDAALRERYLWHEFGDSCLLLP